MVSKAFKLVRLSITVEIKVLGFTRVTLWIASLTAWRCPVAPSSKYPDRLTPSRQTGQPSASTADTRTHDGIHVLQETLSSEHFVESMWSDLGDIESLCQPGCGLVEDHKDVDLSFASSLGY